MHAVGVRRHRPPLPRRALLAIGLLLVTLIASAVTHLAGTGLASGEGAGETVEAAAPPSTILPVVLGPLGSMVVLAAIWLARGRSLSSWWFVLVPPLAFGLQEASERLFDAGSLPFGGAEPSLAASLLTQLPFALLAVLLARLFRAAVRKVVAFLRARRHWPRGRFSTGRSWTSPPVFWPSLATPAGVHLGRAPPLLR